MQSLLETALGRKEIVSVKLLENDDYNIIGFPESVGDDECKFKIIDEYGFEDGLRKNKRYFRACIYDGKRKALFEALENQRFTPRMISVMQHGKCNFY